MRIPDISTHQNILIAGATASGKSQLALEIAQKHGGIIVNADAVQVYSAWRILSARPSVEDEAAAKHVLYGHLPNDATYSSGQWLRDIKTLLAQDQRLIIVGGTGLYFTALTEGLADIPPIDPSIRNEAQFRAKDQGFESLLAEISSQTRSSIDTKNPMRVMRAWEVEKATGRTLKEWQDKTPAPLLPLDETQSILLDLDKETLNSRINQRFDAMLDAGLLDEAKANAQDFEPAAPAHKAIGAQEMIEVITNQRSLSSACEKVKISTRQFAKRQRTWFKSRMGRWGRATNITL